MMMFFIFVFCATINYYGLSKFISLWFITRKCVAGKPWLFTYTFFLSIMLLGALTSASPAVVIGWSILYGICDKCGYQKGEGYPTMMVFGIVYAAQIGMSIIPFKQVPFTVLGAYEDVYKRQPQSRMEASVFAASSTSPRNRPISSETQSISPDVAASVSRRSA